MKYFLTIVTLTVISSIVSINAQEANPDAAIKPRTITLVDTNPMNADEMIAAACIQGIANRTEPNVYLRSANRFWPISYFFYKDFKTSITPETLEKYPAPDYYWIDQYAKKWNYQFEMVPGLDVLFDSYREMIKGTVRIVDPDPTSLMIAATIAGVEDLVIVTDTLAAKWPSLAAAPVKVDLRERLPKNLTVEQKKAAMEWMLKTYLDRTSKDHVFTYMPGQAGFITLDMVIAKRMCAYYLLHVLPDHPKDHDTKRMLESPTPTGMTHEEERVLLDQILSRLNPMFGIWGWEHDARNEIAVARRSAQYGGTAVCCTANNVSFHAVVPTKNKIMPRQRVLKDDDIKVEDKYYITFVSGAGGAVHTLTGLMCNGRWLYSGRGSVPMNWSVDGFIAQYMPGMLEIFYETATPNDYFVNDTIGYGYNYPGLMPDDLLFKFGEKIKETSKITDVHYTCLWWDTSINPESKRFEWFKTLGQKGLFPWRGPQKVIFRENGPIEIQSERFFKDYHPYGDPKTSPEALAKSLMTQMEGVKPPWFTIIYDGDPNYIAQLIKILPADKYKVVLMDEFYSLAQKARYEVEGREVHPK